LHIVLTFSLNHTLVCLQLGGNVRTIVVALVLLGCNKSIPNEGYVDVGSGWNASCGLKADGAVYCWDGMESPGSEHVFTTLDVGYSVACGIKEDKTLLCWGTSEWDDDTGMDTLPVWEAPTGTYLDVGVGRSHACALGTDGFVVCWGGPASEEPYVDLPTEAFVSMASGAGHGAALSADGTLSSWGNYQPTEKPTESFASLEAGYREMCGLTLAGTIACWADEDPWVDEVPSTGSWLGISAGLASTGCGVKADGALECWGGGDTASAPSGSFTAVAVGGSHACAVKDDTSIVCWGSGTSPDGLKPI
jgi:alpha-tubulin suppressor-like RCC1 family protein